MRTAASIPWGNAWRMPSNRAARAMQVIGVIEDIELGAIPSKIAEIEDRVVSRVVLRIEDARSPSGNLIDTSTLVGLHFQGPPELVERFERGERVRIETTTPSGMHIQSIEPAPLS